MKHLYLVLGLLAACTSHESEEKKNPLQSPEKKDPADLSAETLVKMARSARDGQNIETALRLYELALKRKPEDTNLPFEYTELLVMAGLYEDAQKQIDKVLKLAPNDARFIALQGRMALSEDEHPRALKFYQRAIELRPDNVSYLEAAGVCLDMLLRHKDAQELYQKALDKRSDSRTLRGNYALSLGLTQDYEAAFQILEKQAMGSDSTHRDRQNFALLKGLSGDIEEAARIYRADLDTESVRNNLAYIRKLQDPKMVAEMLKKVKIERQAYIKSWNDAQSPKAKDAIADGVTSVSPPSN